MDYIQEAIDYAREAHKGQVRKNNGRDYFDDHCLRLFHRLSDDPVYGHDMTAKLVIILHDVVEDCSGGDTDELRQVRYDEIQEKFGGMVAGGVRELTNEYTKLRYPEWNRRKRKDNELLRLSLISERGRTLKLYDREINLQDSISDGDFNKGYAQESWSLAFHLSGSETYNQAVKVMALAAAIRDKCKK